MKKKLLGALAASVLIVSQASSQVVYQNHSKTPSLVKLNTTDFPAVQAFGLISSWDTLAGSPSYRFGGSADGAGLLKNADGTYLYVVNHEDNFAVSRVTLDATFKPVKGEYLMNSDAGMWRLCSGTMATPEEHGFGPLFITCGESSVESMTHAINPYGNPVTSSSVSTLTTVTGLGRWNAENAVPLPKNTYPGKTVVIIGDDDGGVNGGQVALYISNTGDLHNGQLYVLRRKDLNQSERQIALNGSYPVEFVLIPNHKALTGDQINKISDTTIKSIKFGRVEDVDYRKGNPVAGREVYFVTTGAGYTGQDSVNKTIWGRMYRLKLDPANPLSGTIECLVDGDDKTPSNPGAPLYDPDNICVTEDYVYIQEDPNGYTMPWAQPYVHDARIYQYDIESKTVKTLMEFDHHRSAPDSAMFNRNSAGTTYAKSNIGGWEYGAMIDVSKETGKENSFMLALQPHTFRYTFFAGVDGGALRATENQGSMIITLTNIPRIKTKAPSANGITICNGSTAMLTATGGSTFADDNGTTYRWYTVASGGSPVFTGKNFITPALTANTTYHVSAFVSGMESATRTPVTVTVNAVPVVALGGNKTACESTVLDAGNAGVSYAWSNGKNTQTITVTESGKYKVMVANNGCTKTDSVNVTINAKPAAPTITLKHYSTLHSNKTTGNKWYKDGVQVSTDSVYNVTGNGVYSLTYTDANGCTSDAASINFTSLGVADAFEIRGFRLFPNPNSGVFTLKYESGETKSLTIQVVNMIGQLVYSEEIPNFKGSYNNDIDLSAAPAGNYIVNIVTDNNIVQKKVVKQ